MFLISTCSFLGPLSKTWRLDRLQLQSATRHHEKSVLLTRPDPIEEVASRWRFDVVGEVSWVDYDSEKLIDIRERE